MRAERSVYIRLSCPACEHPIACAPGSCRCPGCGGQVAVESDPGKGSVFTVAIPLAFSPDAEAAVAAD